jgi:acetate CoA/acetoacetate CoA-transferase alpha subunit
MDMDAAMENIRDGATIMLGGFLGIGSPLRAIDKLVELGVKDLTVISNVNAHPGGGFDMEVLYTHKQVKKLITSHAGTCQIAMEQFAAGEIEIEYFPMGTFVEKIRAAGSGLGGFLTATGVGTLVEEGKQKITIDGKEYLLELPLRADFAFIKGYRGDRYGNIQYRRVSLNSNPVMATAADFTVAEVNEIVEIGDIPPESVGTPSIFVQAVVQGNTMDEHQSAYTDQWTRSGQLK